MKEVKRLAASASLTNDNYNQYVILEFKDSDGGHFGLHPRMTENALILADPQRPAYALQIQGDPVVLKRVANALNTLARGMEGDSSPSDEE